MWDTLETVRAYTLRPSKYETFLTDAIVFTVTPKQTEGLMKFVTRAQAYAPHFKGPVPVEAAVQTIRSLWERASIESGYAGAFVSQFGNRQWI